MNMRWQASFVSALALIVVAGAAFGDVVYLDATFDDKTVNAPIGTGGAAVGEPVWVSSYIDAIVRAAPFDSRCLEISDDSSISAGAARFEFLDGVEVTWATLTINVHLWFDGLEHYALYVREQGTSAESFATLKFLPSGQVEANDKDSYLGMIGTYTVGRPYTVSLAYDMTDGTYDIYLDGCLAVENETHGVVGRGIGRVAIGMGFDTDLDGRFYVDHVSVIQGVRPLGICPGTCILEAGFDDKVIDAPIGTGGPEEGEPVTVAPQIVATVRGAPFETPCLEIVDNSTSAAGTARFEFLGRREVTTRTITLNADLWFDVMDDYDVRVREQSSSAQSFVNVGFYQSGIIQVSDADSFLGTIGTYETDRVYPMSLVFDMDADTYDLYLDGCLIVQDEPHGVVGRGPGALLIGTGHDPDLAGRLFVDNISVCEGVQPVVDCCPADLDGSGDAGFSDILEIIGAWGPCGVPCPEDLNGNGSVDFADILAVIGAWGSCAEPGACCLDNLSCIVVTEAACDAQAGTFQGTGTTCGSIDCFAACVAGSGSCFASGPTPGCDDPYCCNLVCTLDPYCCDVMWDLTCVQEANSLCAP
ncbi:MAG: hypothetical protein GY715_14645 [Planctomycetes bacterium]|nr:hypothetical protein [Planctomycetota bacterium]